MQIAGTGTPPFRPLTDQEDQGIVEHLESGGADIVWLAIGSLKQERWMAEHVGKVGVPVLIGVGAAFYFVSGRKPQAPVWIQRGGLEWMYRLLSETALSPAAPQGIFQVRLASDARTSDVD